MLVVPLMTPILAAAVATVRAENRELFGALLIIAMGTVLAILVGYATSAIASDAVRGTTDLPGEVKARTFPGLLDLGIAVTAGAAAGYILPRRSATSALPGVGIAVALVPPLIPPFSDPPGCVLFKQASFAFGWMPEGLELGPDGDIDFFVLPADEVGTPAPIVAGVDLAVAFDDRPEVAAVLAYLATPEAGRAWAQGGSYVSPRNDVDPVSYYQPADQAMADLLLTSDTVVFDASDAMPPEIGTTLSWEQITDWIAGQISYEQLAQTLDDARLP